MCGPGLRVKRTSCLVLYNMYDRVFFSHLHFVAALKYNSTEREDGQKNHLHFRINLTVLPEMAYSPLGEATVTAEAFPMLSTGPRPTWLLKLRTCQPITLASCWTACTWCCDICDDTKDTKRHVTFKKNRKGCNKKQQLIQNNSYGYQDVNCDTCERRKSCSSCSWCDSVTTRPSLCTTRICSTPMFSCSWMDLNT